MEIVEHISKNKVNQLFSDPNERIVVPPYQRRYSWKKKHLEDLWNDLEALKDGEFHFFGSIVFMSKRHRAQSVNEISVVDGQQRITTVSILLCTIRDYLKENFPEKAQNRITGIEKALWFVDRDGKKQGLRITLGNLDRESYENLVYSNLDDVTNENLRKAYEYFKSKLETLGALGKITNLHDKLLDKLVYVGITTNGHKDAYHLFEAMNNRGLTLSPIDLMKNYLLMKATEKDSLDEKDEERIEKLWGEIIKNIDSLEIRNPAITFFRQLFMSSPSYEMGDKITKNKLYEPVFEDIVNESEVLIELLQDIKEQSQLYHKMITGSIDTLDKYKNSAINRLLKEALTISITPFTLFLRAFQEEVDYETLKEIIRKSTVLLVRRRITEKRTSEHDVIFSHLAENGFENDILGYMNEYLQKEGRFPEDGQFIEAFSNRQFRSNDRTRYILSKIEEEHFGHGGKEVKQNWKEVHIEHILPQRYGKRLQKLWLDEFDFTKEEHESFKKRIGNLTLLEERPNIHASNRTLERKREYYDNETDFEMTQELTEYRNWRKDEIGERSRKLARISAKIWSLNKTDF